MINPVSTNATPGITPKAEAVPVKVSTEVSAAKMPEDTVQLSPSAQARALRQAGQSIPQIAIKLGLAIPTVTAFFEE
jgi:cytoskeletal protein RodZ